MAPLHHAFDPGFRAVAVVVGNHRISGFGSQYIDTDQDLGAYFDMLTLHICSELCVIHGPVLSGIDLPKRDRQVDAIWIRKWWREMQAGQSTVAQTDTEGILMTAVRLIREYGG